jgi:hypothetical protein
MINGVNQSNFVILPMLGKHANEYPRFRDCFATDGKIKVFTRLGGGNREDYQAEIDILRAMPEYVTDYDDEFDCTYATFVFKVPEKWQKDYDLIIGGSFKDISEEYKQEIYRVYPKLKVQLEEVFAKLEGNK